MLSEVHLSNTVEYIVVICQEAVYEGLPGSQTLSALVRICYTAVYLMVAE